MKELIDEVVTAVKTVQMFQAGYYQTVIKEGRS